MGTSRTEGTATTGLNGLALIACIPNTSRSCDNIVMKTAFIPSLDYMLTAFDVVFS